MYYDLLLFSVRFIESNFVLSRPQNLHRRPCCRLLCVTACVCRRWSQLHADFSRDGNTCNGRVTWRIRQHYRRLGHSDVRRRFNLLLAISLVFAATNMQQLECCKLRIVATFDAVSHFYSLSAYQFQSVYLYASFRKTYIDAINGACA